MDSSTSSTIEHPSGTGEVAGIAPAAARRMLEHTLWSMWSRFGLAPRCRLVEEPHIGRFETPIDRTPYNTVLRFQVADDEAADAEIDDVLATYRSRQTPLTWIVPPSAEPHDLVDRLVRRGLAAGEPIDGMIARVAETDTARHAPDEVTIEEVTPANLDLFLDLVCLRYAVSDEQRAVLTDVARAAGIAEPDSPTRSWIARRAETPLAKATLHATDECVGIFGVATRPEARGLGLGRAVTATAIEAAADDGHEIAVLHSTEMAVELYRSIGFHHAADFTMIH